VDWCEAGWGLFGVGWNGFMTGSGRVWSGDSGYVGWCGVETDSRDNDHYYDGEDFDSIEYDRPAYDDPDFTIEPVSQSSSILSSHVSAIYDAK